MTTRQQSQQALEVLTEVLLLDNDHSIRKALSDAGCTSIFDLIGLSVAQIDELSYSDSGTIRPLPPTLRNMIHGLHGLAAYRSSTH